MPGTGIIDWELLGCGLHECGPLDWVWTVWRLLGCWRPWMWTIGCAVRFRFEAKLSKTEAIFFLLRNETQGFVSLWSEKEDFICKTKRKWSEKIEAKRMKEAKRKKQSKNKQTNYFLAKWRENSLYLFSLWSETKIGKRNKANRKLWKRKEKYGSKTKRK